MTAPTTGVRTPWRQVEMPPAIARLPKDRRGFPVPWVSCWGKDSSHLRPTPVTVDFGAYVVQVMAARCDHVAGVGEPELAELCAGRQNLGMIERRCDACGDVIDGDLHFIGSISNTSFREPPLHLECAVYSLLVCPGISVAPGIGVQTCTDFHSAPSFMLQSDAVAMGQAAAPRTFQSFFKACTYMQATEDQGVLIDIHATPVKPLVRTREAFLAAYR